jgi:hypothetical protein
MRLQAEMKQIRNMDIASQNPFGSASQAKTFRTQDDRLAIRDDEINQMASAEQGREGRDPGNPHPSRAFSSDCADLVHELANTTTAVLMNAQVLGWKLPPYSRLKRPLREIERNAQRGGELMKRLLRRLANDTTEAVNEPGPCANDSGLGLTNAVTAEEPGVDSGSTANLLRANLYPAPVFSCAPKVELTSECDACTSTFPKKG